MKALFVVQNAFGFACQYPVMQRLHTEFGALVRSLPLSPELGPTISDRAQRLAFQKSTIDFAAAGRARWDTVVYTDQYGPTFGPSTLHAVMAHGSAFGVSDYSLQMALHEDFDVYLGLSEADRNYVITHSSTPRKHGRRVRVVGFPKCDALINRPTKREVVLHSLGLPLNRQTILITSHWERESLVRRLNRRILPAVVQLAKTYNVILTGHPKLWGKVPPEFAEERALFLSNIDGALRTDRFLRFVPSTNVERLLPAADLLVGDQSSVVTAYSLLDRPIIFFNNPHFRFFEREVFRIYRRASTAFVDPADLPGLCRASLDQPAREAAGRQTMRDYFFAHPGSAAKRTAEVLAACSPTGLKCEAARRRRRFAATSGAHRRTAGVRP